MAIWTAVGALIGGAIKIGNIIANSAARQRAYDQAVSRAHDNLRQGQGQASLNYDMLAADQKAQIALSGVASDEGTAVQMQNQVYLTKKATINKMGRDFEAWRADLQEQKTVADINDAFSLLGTVVDMTATGLYTDWRAEEKPGSVNPDAPVNTGYTGLTMPSYAENTVGGLYSNPSLPGYQGGGFLLGLEQDNWRGVNTGRFQYQWGKD